MSVASAVRRAVARVKIPCAAIETAHNTVTSSARQFSSTAVRNMKLVQFSVTGKPAEIRAGYLVDNNVVDINKADSSLPSTLLEILRSGYLEKVKKLKPASTAILPLSSVTLKAPIHGVDKVLCIGLNYKDHCSEQNLTPPSVPMVFSKFSSCIIGPNDEVKLRSTTKKVDWEVELCVVIGKTASAVTAADAPKYILGCTVAQDISARDWQKEKNAGQFLLGKAMDTFCPIGPCIVTSDELGDPENLAIKCSINGEVKQTSRTDQLVHKIGSIIERISSVITLLPGDLILTGTPGGVGMYRSPPEYLKAGDVVTSEIEKIGILTTKVRDF